jgi:L-glyceraldehyde 3-phosphate reductase
MFDRWIEDGLMDVLQSEGVGCIAFSPLAQGLLTDRYLKGIPEGSRASKKHGFLRPKDITDEKLTIVQNLNQLAKERGQSLAQMAIIRFALKDDLGVDRCQCGQGRNASVLSITWLFLRPS